MTKTKTRLVAFAVAVMATLIALGSVVAAATGRFGDVPEGHYAYDAVEWAAANDIIAGCGDGTNFCPDTPLNRAHLATILYRYHRTEGCKLAAPVEPVRFRLGDRPGDPLWKRDLTPGAYLVEVHWTEAAYRGSVRVVARTGTRFVELTDDTLFPDPDGDAKPWTDLATLVVLDDPDYGELQAGRVTFRVSELDNGEGFVSGRLDITRVC